MDRASLAARARDALVLGVLAMVVLAGCATVWAGLGPQGPPSGTASARRLQRGPHDVGQRDFEFVDRGRATRANGAFPGSPSRTLETAVWFPKNADGPLPLVIYSHGFLSHRWEGEYLAEHLASHGFVVAAPDYPLTNGDAPGGPDVRDVVEQPADASFLIDTLLSLRGEERTFEARVDPERIGAMGLSLGGLTTTLLAFHPQLRDERVRVAISIAGPIGLFSRRFFENQEVPLLMIAGTEDAIVPYAAHAPPLLDRAPTGSLLSIEGGSHVGFAGPAATIPFLRFSHNPDGIGCRYLMRHLELEPEDVRNEETWAELGGSEIGVMLSADLPLPCANDDLPRSIRPPRQQVITQLAVRAFFQSHFAEQEEERRAAARYLAGELERDLPEAAYQPPAR